ncbi:MAG TPA: mandelate racemase/muconate lactonizing enzyme family protein [Prosthecobacter sp.]|nr:mandelate racemase/muconate lactonizing enzyme family protein [Prosthecobacter sp.]
MPPDAVTISPAPKAAPNSSGLKITALETVIPADIMPGLLLLRIHTDAGFIGHGETYYAPHAVAAMIHDWMGRRLLGSDPLSIESHWRFLYERASAFGSRGAELRAISAIDLALWDILGQVCGRPVWQLLGGKARARVRLYNSSGGPTYGRRADTACDQGWPGHGDIGKPGPLEDNWASNHAAGDLAEELVAEGYAAMKFWTFDCAYHEHGGAFLPWSVVKQCVRPMEEVRERVGDKIEILLDGHGFFQLPAALRIAEVMRDLRPLWLEDVMRVDNADTLADFRAKAGVPIAVSEMLTSREDYRLVLERRAADYIMIDPTWVGGISETRRLAEYAHAYNLPATMHDCTGPLTLFAGLHVATAVPNVVFQESVRAHIRTFYSQLIETNIEIENGWALPPAAPGLGTRLCPALFDPQRDGYRITRFG